MLQNLQCQTTFSDKFLQTNNFSPQLIDIPSKSVIFYTNQICIQQKSQHIINAFV